MRHKKGIKKLSKPTDQRIALLKSLSKSLITYKQITITDTRAKEVKKYIEKLITLSKVDTVTNKRKVFDKLQDKELVKQICMLAKKQVQRNGGYTRIIKKGYRQGDGALMSMIEFVS